MGKIGGPPRLPLENSPAAIFARPGWKGEVRISDAFFRPSSLNPERLRVLLSSYRRADPHAGDVAEVESKADACNMLHGLVPSPWLPLVTPGIGPHGVPSENRNKYQPRTRPRQHRRLRVHHQLGYSDHPPDRGPLRRKQGAQPRLTPLVGGPNTSTPCPDPLLPSQPGRPKADFPSERASNSHRPPTEPTSPLLDDPDVRPRGLAGFLSHSGLRSPSSISSPQRK